MRGNGRLISGALASAGVCSALALAGVTAGTVPARAGDGPGGQRRRAVDHVLPGRGAAAPASAAAGAHGRHGPQHGPHGRSRAEGRARKRRATVPVIVFLKNQWAGAGTQIRSDERGALIQAAQAPYLGQLRALGATGVTGYRLADAIAARVPAAALGAIAPPPGWRR